MAVHTAIGLVLLNLGILAAWASRGWVAPLIEGGSVAVSVGRRLVPVALVMPMVGGVPLVRVEHAAVFSSSLRHRRECGHLGVSVGGPDSLVGGERRAPDPIKDGAGPTHGIVLVFKDISEQRAHELRLSAPSHRRLERAHRRTARQRCFHVKCPQFCLGRKPAQATRRHIRMDGL